MSKATEPRFAFSAGRFAAEAIRQKRMGGSAKQRSCYPAERNVRRKTMGCLSSSAQLCLSFGLRSQDQWEAEMGQDDELPFG